ncbi:hypothetical protein [Hoeflea sp. YIM 152468]|uniref:hypothetical protein n=1 Tax=Hoeflea sp. YIM 152468 TaxID=3031759 RepID=UPI0031B811B3
MISGSDAFGEAHETVSRHRTGTVNPVFDWRAGIPEGIRQWIAGQTVVCWISLNDIRGSRGNDNVLGERACADTGRVDNKKIPERVSLRDLPKQPEKIKLRRARFQTLVDSLQRAQLPALSSHVPSGPATHGLCPDDFVTATELVIPKNFLICNLLIQSTNHYRNHRIGCSAVDAY